MGCVPTKEVIQSIRNIELQESEYDCSRYSNISNVTRCDSDIRVMTNGSTNGVTSDNEIISDSDAIRTQDEETLNDIRKDLNENPEMFLLNNVLMCTFFHTNYQRDLNKLNKQLQSKVERFVEPDGILEKANENVIYKPLHGIKKESPEPLVTKRIYVPVNDIVDVIKPGGHADEETNTNKYLLEMEESKRKGYMKLKRVNQSHHQDLNYPKDMLAVPSSSTSGTSETSSDTTTSCYSNVPLGTQQLIMNQEDDSIRVLQDCFVYRKKKKQDADLNLEDSHENLSEEDVYTIEAYLTSRDFMKYFQSRMFRNSIAKELGLVEYEIDHAVVYHKIPGKIFCNILDNDGNNHPIEVIPCINISWPEAQTYEFCTSREMVDLEEVFTFPTRRMLKEIKRLDCALVPRGYSRKSIRRIQSPEAELEWEIHFPMAERYIQSLLRPQQIKCYLIFLALHKEYIESFTKKHGVGPEHFRTLLFWESEIDYDSWPEHRLGIKFMSILKNLSHALHQGYLPDYFLGKNKNVFKNVHKKHLNLANEVFHIILQSPIMMIIKALRNLRTASGKFYPPLNYKELLQILYKKEWPIFISMNANGENDSTYGSSTSLIKKPRFTDAEKQLEYQKELDRKRKLIRKRMKQKEGSHSANLRYSVDGETRKESVDSIDLEWECERNFDTPKKIALLKFFINSYLNIAKTSFRISTKRQTMFYLKQAWYLTRILASMNPLCLEVAQEFLSRIEHDELECLNSMSEDQEEYGSVDEELSPSSPKNLGRSFNDIRLNLDNTSDNSLCRDIRRQVRQTQINLRTLSRSFSNNYPNVEENSLS